MNKILYLLTTLRPKFPAGEAIAQEISALQGHFGGDLVYLNPNQHSPVFVPRLLYGFDRLPNLRRREADVRLHHLYNPDPYPFRFLRLLRRPVVYSLSCGLRDQRPDLAFFSKLAAVVASDERSLARLKSWGLTNVYLAKPGIDASRFSYSPLPLGPDIRIIIGSAPWASSQFASKGVDTLLQAAAGNPRLQLTFLWRGVLAGEMQRRVQALGLEGQVLVLDRLVDVDQVLAGVHAAALLVTDPAIIKSYPHSLLDSLAAGKPVIVSHNIPMSDYVQRTGCGVVVEDITPEGVLAAVEALVEDYPALQAAARQAGQRDFTRQAMLDSFQHIYQQVLSLPTG